MIIIEIGHIMIIITIIVSITKFLIVIGSLHTYLSLNQRAITSIMCALKASFTMFSIVIKAYEKRYRWNLLKTSSQKTSLIPKFVIDMIN